MVVVVVVVGGGALGAVVVGRGGSDDILGGVRCGWSGSRRGCLCGCALVVLGWVGG